MSYPARYPNEPRNFSSASAQGRPLQRGLLSSASSLFGVPGNIGSRISVSSLPGLSYMRRPDGQQNGGGPKQDDRETMKGLNDRLADYLSRVRELEQSNAKLEEQIKDVLKQRGIANERDWSVYEKPLAELRKQVRDMTMENARLLLQIDNVRLAAEDFKVKFDSEQAMRQSVEQDVMGLRKITDSTNMSCLQLEGQTESLKEELAFLKKNHQEEVNQLCRQISDCDVRVELDTSKAADLNEIIANIRSQYEKTAQKSKEDAEAWYKNKFDDLTAEVTHNTEALEEGKNELTELQRQRQMLEIDLHSMQNLNRSLEDTLNETEARLARDINTLNQCILQLEAQLNEIRTQAERQAADYQALLNIKTKLDEEIQHYQQLLENGAGEWEELDLRQALQADQGLKGAQDVDLRVTGKEEPVTKGEEREPSE